MSSFLIKYSNVGVSGFVLERWLGWHEAGALGLWHKRGHQVPAPLSPASPESVREPETEP